MSMRRRFLSLLLAFILRPSSAGTALAFTDMSMQTLENSMQKMMRSGSQGTKARLQKLLGSFSKADMRRYTRSEAVARMKKLVEKGQVPSYILERGKYDYITGNNILHLVGANIRLRSQPNTKARIITTLNTQFTDYLVYLGEWKNPKGERWVFVSDNMRNAGSGRLGWVYGKYARLISNARVERSIAQAAQAKDAAADNVTRSGSGGPSTMSRRNETHRSSTSKASEPSGGKLLQNDFPLLCIFVFFVLIAGIPWCDKNADGDIYVFITNIIIVTVIGIGAYYVVKFIFLKIIIPILAAILLLGSGGIGGSGGKGDSGPSCTHHERRRCGGCFHIDPNDTYHEYQKCNYLDCYVDPDLKPEINAQYPKYR